MKCDDIAGIVMGVIALLVLIALIGMAISSVPDRCSNHYYVDEETKWFVRKSVPCDSFSCEGEYTEVTRYMGKNLLNLPGWGWDNSCVYINKTSEVNP